MWAEAIIALGAVIHAEDDESDRFLCTLNNYLSNFKKHILHIPTNSLTIEIKNVLMRIESKIFPGLFSLSPMNELQIIYT
jgi:hypothetical protein